jgi:hypothetical protein
MAEHLILLPTAAGGGQRVKCHASNAPRMRALRLEA